MPYSNWNTGEPNGGTSENCAFINVLTGRWADVPCSKTYWTMCEKAVEINPKGNTSNFFNTILYYLNLERAWQKVKRLHLFKKIINKALLSGFNSKQECIMSANFQRTCFEDLGLGTFNSGISRCQALGGHFPVVTKSIVMTFLANKFGHFWMGLKTDRFCFTLLYNCFCFDTLNLKIIPHAAFWLQPVPWKKKIRRGSADKLRLGFYFMVLLQGLYYYYARTAVKHAPHTCKKQPSINKISGKFKMDLVWAIPLGDTTGWLYHTVVRTSTAISCDAVPTFYFLYWS